MPLILLLLHLNKFQSSERACVVLVDTHTKRFVSALDLVFCFYTDCLQCGCGRLYQIKFDLFSRPQNWFGLSECVCECECEWVWSVGRSVITCWLCRHDDGNDDGWTLKTNPNSHGCLSVSVSVLRIWPNPEKARGPFVGGWRQYFSGKLSKMTI